jgi:hypothetical protein
VFISVTLLFGEGKRLSAYVIKKQRPKIGWLHYELGDKGHYLNCSVMAKLLNENGQELLVLDHARLVACRGQQGALIEGVEYRKKGRKHSISDRQAWWCEAPPRATPLLVHHARIAAVEKHCAKLNAAWEITEQYTAHDE